MKFVISLFTFILLASPILAQSKKLVEAKDGSGVIGYKDTPVQPWSGFHVHDPDRPKPPQVDPGKPGTAPSDAVVLFDGKNLDQWEANTWKVENGEMVATGKTLYSKQAFGDCQLHLEWMPPVELESNSMNQGNNGLQFLRRIEIQIFDSHRVKIYPDGQAASIYAQTPPAVNVCRAPGEWQTYDVIFLAPRFDKDGKVTQPARITMLHNGVLVHHNQEVYGHSPHRNLPSYNGMPATGPIGLMAHHCPVRFRNIWVRPLNKPKE